MKLLFTLLFFVLCKTSFAQTAPPPDSKTITRTRIITANPTRMPLDTNELITDENGKELRYYQSQKLLNTGDYTIWSQGPNTKKYLKKINEQQQIAAYERLKQMMALSGPNLKEGNTLDVTPLLTTLNKNDIDHKVIVMIFWYADCPPCTESFSALNDFFAQIRNPENIIVLAITNNDQTVAAAKLKEKPLLHTKLISNASRITSAYDLHSYPAFVVTDKDHVIHFATKGIGPISIAAFKNAIRTVLYN